jgi:hypothetical protein
MPFTELLVLVARFAGDLVIVVLLYDFFVQPFRFYGMDPLTRFVWAAARKICSPFETISRKIIQLPDRDLTPLFTLATVVLIRGILYSLPASLSGPSATIVIAGITLSFQELFTRLLIPGLLFVVYADIQLSRHQETFAGNIFVMLVHDVAKRFIVMIRRLLPSYQPLHVFLTVFVILVLFEWLFMVVTLLPFSDTMVFNDFPRAMTPEMSHPKWLEVPLATFPLVFLRLTQMFLFGIFLLVLMHMVTGFSGLDPYNHSSLMLGLVVSPWLTLSRRMFPFARIGAIDFSIAILLFVPYIVLGWLEWLLNWGVG